MLLCLLLASGFLRDRSYPMSLYRPIPLSIHQSIHSRISCCLPMKSKVGHLINPIIAPFPCCPLPRNPLAALDATCFQCALSCYWPHPVSSTWAFGKENINANASIMSSYISYLHCFPSLLFFQWRYVTSRALANCAIHRVLPIWWYGCFVYSGSANCVTGSSSIDTG